MHIFMGVLAPHDRAASLGFRVYLHFTSESFGVLDLWAGGSDSDVPSSMKIFGFPWLVFSPCHLHRRCRRHGALGIFRVYFFCLTVES